MVVIQLRRAQNIINSKMGDGVHHGSVRAIKTFTVIPNYTGFPATAH